jgi:hypothetical protein
MGSVPQVQWFVSLRRERLAHVYRTVQIEDWDGWVAREYMHFLRLDLMGLGVVSSEPMSYLQNMA